MTALLHGAADAVVLVHLAFILYVLVGGFVAWRLPRTIVLHAMAAVWGLLIVTTPVQCPLTWLQNRIRAHSGEAQLARGFIETYVSGTFYPTSAQTLAQVITTVAVLVSWAGYATRVLPRRHGAA